MAGLWTDAYLGLCEAQVTLDEFRRDSDSYAKGCMYTLNKMSRWGRDMGVPAMVAHDLDSLSSMPPDHRQLSWYFVDQTSAVLGSKFDTVKSHRGAVFNYYTRLGVPNAEIPTASFRFTHRMHGLEQRLGSESEQARVFEDVLLEDMIALLKADYVRARGANRLQLALVNLAFHGYTQAGLRANEWFEQTLGALERGFCFGEEAARKRVRPHFRLRVKAQTKENRMFTRKVLCCEHAKRAPLCAGVWARAVVRDMRAAGRSHDDALVFAEPDGRAWRMTVFWFSHIRPRLEQLQREMLGGLEKVDLSDYASNSFRRTWATLAARHPDPVSKDLMDRQGRWASKQAQPSVMASLYTDPGLGELLLPTYWL